MKKYKTGTFGALARLLRRTLANIRQLTSDDPWYNDNRLKQQGKQLAAAREDCKFLMQTLLHDQDSWLFNNHNRHKGERCFLLGCGPSLNKIDLSKIRDEIVMGVNGTLLLENLDLDYFVTVSNFFWKSHVKMIRNAKVKRRFLPEYLREHLTSEVPTSWLFPIRRSDTASYLNECPVRFSYHPEQYVFLGGSVIFVCLQILFWLGFTEVVILGLDHDYGTPVDVIGDNGSFVNSDELNAHFTSKYYRKGEQVHIDMVGSERAYRLGCEAFQAAGRKIINASPGTMLDILPKAKFDDLF